MASKSTDIESLLRQIDDLKSKLSETTQALSEVAKDRGAQVGEIASFKGSRIYNEGEKQLDQLQLRAEKAATQAKDKVRENPAMAIAVAMGVTAGAAYLISMVKERR